MSKENNKTKQFNIQTITLNKARSESIEVTVYLINNVSVTGYIHDFDSYSILIDANGKQNLVYKHAIISIEFK